MACAFKLSLFLLVVLGSMLFRVVLPEGQAEPRPVKVEHCYSYSGKIVCAVKSDLSGQVVSQEVLSFSDFEKAKGDADFIGREQDQPSQVEEIRPARVPDEEDTGVQKEIVILDNFVHTMETDTKTTNPSHDMSKPKSILDSVMETMDSDTIKTNTEKGDTKTGGLGMSNNDIDNDIQPTLRLEQSHVHETERVDERTATASPKRTLSEFEDILVESVADRFGGIDEEPMVAVFKIVDTLLHDVCYKACVAGKGVDCYNKCFYEGKKSFEKITLDAGPQKPEKVEFIIDDPAWYKFLMMMYNLFYYILLVIFYIFYLPLWGMYWILKKVLYYLLLVTLWLFKRVLMYLVSNNTIIGFKNTVLNFFNNNKDDILETVKNGLMFVYEFVVNELLSVFLWCQTKVYELYAQV